MSNTAGFPAALGVSLALHLSLIFSLSALGIVPKQAAFSDTEITYYPLKSKSALLEKNTAGESVPKNLDDVAAAQPIILSAENKIPERGIPEPAAGRRELFPRANDFSRKPALSRAEFLVKNTIKLSPAREPESSDKLSRGPAYLTYGNYARERIRRCLVKRFSHINESGVVCLEFSILADGSLSGVSVIDEKSSASDTLKGIALDGLRDAAPFPRLPPDLNSQPATFTVFIHFTIQKNG